MNEFACYLAISRCSKFSNFFVFIRESGQNVRCHKFGGPCVYIHILHTCVYTITIYITYTPNKKRKVSLKRGQPLKSHSLIHPKYRLCRLKSTLFVYQLYLFSHIFTHPCNTSYTISISSQRYLITAQLIYIYLVIFRLHREEAHCMPFLLSQSLFW